MFASQTTKKGDGAEEDRRYRFLKFHTVFNVAQVNELPADIYQVPEPRPLSEALEGADVRDS